MNFWERISGLLNPQAESAAGVTIEATETVSPDGSSVTGSFKQIVSPGLSLRIEGTATHSENPYIIQTPQLLRDVVTGQVVRTIQVEQGTRITDTVSLNVEASAPTDQAIALNPGGMGSFYIGPVEGFNTQPRQTGQPQEQLPPRRQPRQLPMGSESE